MAGSIHLFLFNTDCIPELRHRYSCVHYWISEGSNISPLQEKVEGVNKIPAIGTQFNRLV